MFKQIEKQELIISFLYSNKVSYLICIKNS